MEELLSAFSRNEKMRIIQEIVPGKQITIAHIIANPEPMLFRKLGLKEEDADGKAIGIVTIDPSEAAIIAGDLAVKTAGVTLVVIDHESGTLIVTGTVSEVEASLRALVEYAEQKLGFEVCDITQT